MIARWFQHAFFWGVPNRKSIAWWGAAGGAGVVALAVLLMILGHGAPVFLVALLLLGLANLGWAAELLPARRLCAAGWTRAGRWGCALIGSALALLSLLLGLAFDLWFGLAIAGMGLLQVFEFAPSGPANQP